MRYLLLILWVLLCLAVGMWVGSVLARKAEKPVHFRNPPFKVDTDWVPETVLADELQALRNRHTGVVTSFGIVCPVCDAGDPCVVIRLINTVEKAHDS